MTKFVPHPTIEYNGTPCWEWKAGKFATGYGAIGERGKKVITAHVAAYRIFRGPIPDGLELDHLCRNRWCVNPIHLEAVTHRENCLRGASLPAANAKKTHCSKGHRLIPENLVKRKRYGRECRTCTNARVLARYYRDKGKP